MGLNIDFQFPQRSVHRIFPVNGLEMELNYKEKFDYNVYNYNLDDAKNEVNEIIKSELE